MIESTIKENQIIFNSEINGKIEMPRIVKIEKIIDENDSIKTFIFSNIKLSLYYKPGQFVMVWIPGVDEKPYSISNITEDFFAITVEKKGGFSKAMCDLSIGDKVGIRGPYGNGFLIDNKKYKNPCVIGGGCGVAPIMQLIKGLDNPTVIVGCQTKSRLLFENQINEFNICTDDGSFGYKGFVTEKFKDLLKQTQNKFDIIYTCGPESMMKAVYEICKENNIECQASLERFMICGIGICAQCMCGNKRVCKDGPVFNTEQLSKLQDFGKFAMIKTGKKVTLKEYYSYKTQYNIETKGCNSK